jgi:MFS family permease
MDLRRLRVGEYMVGAAGLALLIALFLPWYSGDAAADTLSGWRSLGALDVILALVALAAIAVPLVTAAQRVPALPLAIESLVTLVAFVATLLVLFRVLNLPDWANGREWGLWLAFASTLGILVGGLIAIRDERRSPAGRHTDAAGVPLAAPREIEAHRAPRAEGGP